jgi:tight adherence protein C
MSPALPALSLLACFVATAAGLYLLRPARAGLRFDVDADEEPPRPGPMQKLYDTVGARLGAQYLQLLPPDRIRRIRHQIDAAGRPEGLTVTGYAARKSVWLVVLGGTGFALLILQGNWISFVLLLTVGWLSMDIWLARRARQRQERIDRDMPDFLDILAIVIGAGLRFRAALSRVAAAMDGPLSEELLTTLRQMDLGAGRRAAFEALRDRNDSVALRTFVTNLIQAEELGSPLGETLLALADDLRKSFHQAARQRAAKAVPRVTLVLVTVVVPGAMIILVTGTVISAADSFGDLFEFLR